MLGMVPLGVVNVSVIILSVPSVVGQYVMLGSAFKFYREDTNHVYKYRPQYRITNFDIESISIF